MTSYPNKKNPFGRKPSQRIILALNLDSVDSISKILDSLDEPVGALRFGLEFGLAHGWAAARKLASDYHLPVFFDTKLKDVPKTLEVGTRSLMSHSPDLFTIMVDNSASALEGIIRGRDEGVQRFKLGKKPLAVGVTILTSISESETVSIYGATP